jgi:signal transduction histidine kinase
MPETRQAAHNSAATVEDLSHTLSGPLTSILVNCELLLDGECPPPVRQRLEGIFAEAQRMSELLQGRRPAR